MEDTTPPSVETFHHVEHKHSMAAIMQENLDVGRRKSVFALMAIMQLFANFDSGVVPSGLNQIMAEYSLTSTQAGWLGSLVYIGLVFSCPITGYLLTNMKESQNKILIGSLFLNIVALILFVNCPSNNKGLLMFTRFLTGLSQAPLFVFPPVWVDEFAPKDSLTLYCALLQAMVPLGITAGFVGCLTFQNTLGISIGWRAAIWLQISVLVPFVVAFSLLPGRHFHVLGGMEARLHDQAKTMMRRSGDYIAKDEGKEVEEEQKGNKKIKIKKNKEEEEEEENDPSTLNQLCTILDRPVYVWIVLGLSAIYFVITGIQFWTVSYMTNVIGAPLFDIQIAYAITSVTSPLLGVFFGGYFVDKMGGYKEDAMATTNTLLTCDIFGTCAVVCAASCAFVNHFVGSVTLIWFVLFFGGAVLPALTGMCLASVPEDCRAVASSFSMFTYNVLGYALAPVLMGFIADSYVDQLDMTCFQNGSRENGSGNRSATSGSGINILCASEIVGATRGFQTAMFTSAVVVLACLIATICQLRLATNGSRPAVLQCIPYDKDSKQGEILMFVSSPRGSPRIGRPTSPGARMLGVVTKALGNNIFRLKEFQQKLQLETALGGGEIDNESDIEIIDMTMSPSHLPSTPLAPRRRPSGSGEKLEFPTSMPLDIGDGKELLNGKSESSSSGGNNNNNRRNIYVVKKDNYT